MYVGQRCELRWQNENLVEAEQGASVQLWCASRALFFWLLWSDEHDWTDLAFAIPQIHIESCWSVVCCLLEILGYAHILQEISNRRLSFVKFSQLALQLWCVLTRACSKWWSWEVHNTGGFSRPIASTAQSSRWASRGTIVLLVSCTQRKSYCTQTTALWVFG